MKDETFTPLPFAAERPGYQLTRFAILRGLGAVYCFAFLTILRQWRPLLGSDGLLPASAFLESVQTALGTRAAAFWRLPTLFWFGSSDAVFRASAGVGLGLALLVAAGFANAGIMTALWALYLSFVHAGQVFYGYGWESLLCEAGFLAIFLGPPWSVKPWAGVAPWPVIVLFRWLTFRVMFGAGLIKIRGDSCWTDLSCLDFHFQTQPMPNPLSAAFHHLPRGVLRDGVLFNHFAELVAPFGVFGPKRLRRLAGGVIIAFQLCLIASGNLSFLNWLTIVASLSCFDDEVFRRLTPKRTYDRLRSLPRRLSRTRAVSCLVLTIVIAVLSLEPAKNLLSSRQRMNAAFDPFDIVNTYGAFGSVNRVRNEVVLEGTPDARLTESTRWSAFELPCKPGDPARRPCWAAPYQYKLDWQMWFAAFSSPGAEPWFIHLVSKLLHGDASVDSLFSRQPFRGHPPHFVRALFYRYEFAGSDEQPYWKRELVGEYLRPVALGDPALDAYLGEHGFDR